VRRNTRDALLDVFDAPEGFSSTAQRNVTTTPVQALLLINSPFMLAQSRAFAERLLKEKHDGDEATVNAAYRLAFGRPATAEERSEGAAFLKEQARRVRPKDGTDPAKAALIDFCHVLLNANEFLYVD
jgi:hypothetical protein